MFKATVIATLFSTAAMSAGADPAASDDLSVLPAEVAARVAELQAHGDRFAPAIRAILAEAQKPGWAFDDCGHESHAMPMAMALPQS